MDKPLVESNIHALNNDVDTRNIEPMIQFHNSTIKSGSTFDPNRVVPFTSQGELPTISFNLVESSPKEGDYLSVFLPILTKVDEGYMLSLDLRSPYEKHKNLGRIKYQVLLNNQLLLEEDIAAWKETNNIQVKWFSKQSTHLIEIRLQVVRDCEEWSWGKVAKMYIQKATLRVYNTNRSILEAKSTSPYSKTFKFDTRNVSHLPQEKVFELVKPIRYIFQESKSKSAHLMVIFSAFNGKEDKGHPPLYNYRKTLSDLDCHKLFILDDYDGEICYYIGKNKDHAYEASVIALINQISNRYKIPGSNVIASGSSKGGAAALYFGFKYELGYIISGAPQVFIYSYLTGIKSKYINNLASSISGGFGKKHRDYLDGLIVNAVDNCKNQPSIHLHISKGDSHYEDHVLPLIDRLNNNGFSYELDLHEYEGHHAVAEHYGAYMVKTVENILN